MSDPVRGPHPARPPERDRCRTPALAAALLAASLAGCQSIRSHVDAPAVMRAGPYAGVALGGVIEQFDLPGDADGESTWTAGLRGGYRFARYAAVEVAYEELGENDLEVSSTDLGELSGRTFVVQGKGYLLHAPLQPYLLAGIGVIDAEFDDSSGLGLGGSETDTVYKLGGGLEAHSGEHLTFFLESAWTKPDGDAEEFEYITVLGGVNWRF